MYKEDWIGLLVISIVFFGIFGFVVGMIWAVDSWGCRIYGAQTETRAEYYFPAGCFIEKKGVWYSHEEWLERYKEISVETNP